MLNVRLGRAFQSSWMKKPQRFSRLSCRLVEGMPVMGLKDGVVRQAGRVTNGSYQLIAKVVLGIEREVVRIGRGQVSRKGSD